MTTTILLAAAGAALLFWPKSLNLSKVKEFLPLDIESCKGCDSSKPTFLEATASLAEVKKRLDETESLDDEQEDAVNVLQLALTKGSNQ